jgi:hypothetical protein
MTDYDLDVLAFVESQVNQTRASIISFTQSIFAASFTVIAEETRSTVASVDLALNRLRPADKKFTLGQIVAMRKIFERMRPQMLAVIENSEKDILTAGRYIETYIAKGVSPKELDITRESLSNNIAPVKVIFDEMTSRISSVHPLAYGVFADAGYDPVRMTKRYDELAKRGIVGLLCCFEDFQDSLKNQQTFLMSGDGLEKRQELIRSIGELVLNIAKFIRAS